MAPGVSPDDRQGTDQVSGRPFAPLERLAAACLGSPEVDATTVERPAEGVDQAALLRLEDLVTDEKGEVLISLGDSLRTVILEGDVAVTDRGMIPASDERHGETSGSLGYLSFETGMTVYFPPDVDVVLSVPST